MPEKSRYKKSAPAKRMVAASSYARGRPKKSATIEISTVIMDAATKIFFDVGYEDATMEAIAVSAGVTKVTLYKRFADKRSLLQAVLRAQRLQWDPLPPSSLNFEIRLKNLASAILVGGVSPEQRALHRLVLSAWPHPSDMPAREEVLGYNVIIDQLEKEILEGGKELGVDPSRARDVAIALMSMLSGWFDHWQPDPERDAVEADRFGRIAVDLLIRGKEGW